jgi:proteasome-associated ATPase
MSSTENPDSVAAAEELHALRVEAQVLRRQLAQSPEQVRELESKVDSLSIRNSKLMDTLKEARQQLIALREEVDRLGQPPSGYGVLLSVHEDKTVDVFTSGR